MKVGRKLLPGQPGTKQWVKQFGERLVCVRYKYDPVRQRKIKTVEVIVEEGHWEAPAKKKKIPKNKIVFIRVNYGEIKLGITVKEAGGHWNKRKKLWELPYQEAVDLGLSERIVWEKNQNVSHIRNFSNKDPT